MPSKLFAALTILAIVATACGGNQPAPPNPNPSQPPRQRTATPVPATDEEAIRQLINAECEAVVQQDVDRLQGMWANDGVVIDANHSKDNTADDVTWKGWDALRDRYVNIIFPSNPTFCEHPDIKVTIGSAEATATSSVKIGVTNCKDCNTWSFSKAGDGWRIVSLTYNLNPQ
jgi:ketosteroid isomerase-like protein